MRVLVVTEVPLVLLSRKLKEIPKAESPKARSKETAGQVEMAEKVSKGVSTSE